jgi:quercetin dioxygenase-like cupin family protein
LPDAALGGGVAEVMAGSVSAAFWASALDRQIGYHILCLRSIAGEARAGPDEPAEEGVSHMSVRTEQHLIVKEQALSETANSEMGQREEWNKKNPPTEAIIVKNLKTTELTPREYRNTKARFYRLGHDIRLQPHLSELPPKGFSVNHRHTTEAVIYIVMGHGHTIISWDGVNQERIEWEEGDMFSFPVWMWHQHFNDSDTEPCRYMAVQDTFAIKALGLHQIERFPEDGAKA